jgi:hypothetical protein
MCRMIVKNHTLIAWRGGMVMAGMLNDRYMGAVTEPWPLFFLSRLRRLAM